MMVTRVQVIITCNKQLLRQNYVFLCEKKFNSWYGLFDNHGLLILIHHKLLTSKNPETQQSPD